MCQEGCPLPRPLSWVCRQPSSPCPHVVGPRAHLCPDFFFFLFGLWPILMASLFLNYLLKDLVSKHSPILRFWELGLQRMNLGTQFRL